MPWNFLLSDRNNKVACWSRWMQPDKRIHKKGNALRSYKKNTMRGRILTKKYWQVTMKDHVQHSCTYICMYHSEEFLQGINRTQRNFTSDHCCEWRYHYVKGICRSIRVGLSIRVCTYIQIVHMYIHTVFKTMFGNWSWENISIFFKSNMYIECTYTVWVELTFYVLLYFILHTSRFIRGVESRTYSWFRRWKFAKCVISHCEGRGRGQTLK